MELGKIKHYLICLKEDLGRESLQMLKHELTQIVEAHSAQIEDHGKFLISTKDEDLPKLKSAALLNKARKESAEHLLAFFNDDYLDKAIKDISRQIERENRDE